MARPSKSVATMSKHLTEEEKAQRLEGEEKLKGKSNNITPPDYLNNNQVELFCYIKGELEESKLLGNLDVFILSKCVIAIDRLQLLESKINKNPKLLMNSQFMKNKKDYDGDFFRCCNELSLSPQSRAKLANINSAANAEKDDPILKALSDDD